MRKAVAITKQAHEEAMAMTAPGGVFEYQWKPRYPTYLEAMVVLVQVIRLWVVETMR